MAVRVAPVNVGRPVAHWYRVAPRLNRSERASGGAPSTCSGARKPGVPGTVPGDVSVSASSAARASPKSSSFALAVSASSQTFAGLTSRWTRPLAAAAASPEATSLPSCSTSAGGSRPARCSRASSDSPRNSGITRKGTPSSSPTW
jgi:hypothetical protein